MIDWLININKDFPEFWKTYLSKFEKKSKRFVVLSTETSGLNPEKDVILSLGAFAVMNNSIYIGDSFETVFAQYKFFYDNGISNEFTVESKMVKLSEAEGIQTLIEFVENAVIVGHQVYYEVEIINAALERLGCGRLKNEALDIEIMHQKLNDITNKQFSLNELATIYKIPKRDTNSSSDDAYEIALLFLKLKSRLGLN